MVPGAPPSSITRGLPRGVVVLIGLAGAVVVVGGMRSASGILAPLMLALVVTITVQPLRAALRRRLPSWASTLICVVVVNVVLLGLAVALVVAAARFGTLVASYANEFHDRVADVTQHLNDAGVSSAQIATLTRGLDLGSLAGVVQSALAGAGGVLSSLVFILALRLAGVLVVGPRPPRRHPGRADVVARARRLRGRGR